MKRVFISDCEGPISVNDNAYELTSHFVPNGARLFTVISRYDDILADVVKKPGYKAGDTLKLVLPFLVAYNVSDQKMSQFSTRRVNLVQGARETMQHLSNTAHAFIVSTSYEHYIRAVCQELKIPFEHSYCTKLRIDEYSATEKQKTSLKAIAGEIAHMPIFEIPEGASSIEDFPRECQHSVRRLDEIFWEEIANMELGCLYSEVDPVGGIEKAKATEEAAQRSETSLADVMYVGDSITDKEALHLVKAHHGLSVSFNGNRYALRSAEIAILSENAIATAVIADLFSKFGTSYVLSFLDSWDREELSKSPVDTVLLDRFLLAYPKELPKARIITDQDMQNLVEESTYVREKVRGKAVGRLG